jgi:hypothetical protein
MSNSEGSALPLQEVYRLRAKLLNEAMDVCTVPECIQPGIVTLEGKQWCESHTAEFRALQKSVKGNA